MRVLSLLPLTAALLACGSTSGVWTFAEPYEPDSYDRVTRASFNQLALRLDLPVFWERDADGDATIDPEEVRPLLFHPTEGRWVRDGALTREFDTAYRAIVRAAQTQPPGDDERRRLVRRELEHALPTLVLNDLTELPEDHQAFARHMLNVAARIDALYARQVGMTALADRVDTSDTESRAVFRRNWGVSCRAPATQDNPTCSAVDGAPAQPVDTYPASLQADDGFCGLLEEREDSESLLAPFVVVREAEGELEAVPYTEEYRTEMTGIADSLEAVADALSDEGEDALRAYLRAAAASHRSNDWGPADEAWAAMNARNSRWYVRVGPDETYWDPCSRKAGFHLTFALINRDSLSWQDRLTPLQGDMERSLAALVPEEYEARDVSFSMPDFIDIVVNAGDDRDPFGATIGQSLPNWGAVSEEGRGRTVAMSNLYTDSDSIRMRRELASTLITAETLASYSDDPTSSLLSTILHEATHNLGPAGEYRVEGRTASEAFGGGLSAMLEELKAQSGALFFLSLLVERGVIEQGLANEAYLDSFVWALGHISRGMYTPSGGRKAYSQLAAVQVGFLMDEGVVTFDAARPAANGEDTGSFAVDFDAFPAAAEKLMTRVMHIMATQDRAAAEALAARFVDGEVVPQTVVVERHLRFPRQSFVYSVSL